jgi:endonuclease YncB( thermonuclease family)
MKTDRLIIIPLLVLCPVIASAHPGKVDKDGGHTNRKTGEYHKHQKKEPVKSCGTVTRVVDGDTFDIKIGGIIQRVRLRRTNAPEVGTKAKRPKLN